MLTTAQSCPQLQGALTTQLIFAPHVYNFTLCPLSSQREVKWVGPGPAQDHPAEKRQIPTRCLGRKPSNPSSNPMGPGPSHLGFPGHPHNSPYSSCLCDILEVARAPHWVHIPVRTMLPTSGVPVDWVGTGTYKEEELEQPCR